MSTNQAWRDQARNNGQFGHRLHPEANIDLGSEGFAFEHVPGTDPFGQGPTRFDEEHRAQTFQMATDEGLRAGWHNSNVISRSNLDAIIADPGNPPAAAPDFVVEHVRAHRVPYVRVNYDASLPVAERVLVAGGPSELHDTKAGHVATSQPGFAAAVFSEDEHGNLIADLGAGTKLHSASPATDARLMDEVRFRSVDHDVWVELDVANFQDDSETRIPLSWGNPEVETSGKYTTIRYGLSGRSDNETAWATATTDYATGETTINLDGADEELNESERELLNRRLRIQSQRAAKLAGGHQAIDHLMAQRRKDTFSRTKSQVKSVQSKLKDRLVRARLQPQKFEDQTTIESGFRPGTSEGQAVMEGSTKGQRIHLTVSPGGQIEGSITDEKIRETTDISSAKRGTKAAKMWEFARANSENLGRLARAADQGMLVRG